MQVAVTKEIVLTPEDEEPAFKNGAWF